MTEFIDEDTCKRVFLLGFGSVGQHVVRLLLDKSPCRPRPEVIVHAIADSSGGIYSKVGLPLAEILDWKQKGNSILSFPSTDDITTHFRDTLTLVQECCLIGDVIFDATPVNLQDGGVGLACCRWGATNGVHLVLANKAPLVLAYSELMQCSLQDPVSLIKYSATVCGGLPVVNVGQRDLACCGKLDSVQGIFNSTSNYVLSRMACGESSELALENAQQVGIAEADATLDLEGYDTANKLIIICNSILNIPATLRDVDIQGINDITKAEIDKAFATGEVYRLIASAERVSHNHASVTANPKESEFICEGFKLSVRPTLVPLISFFGQCVDTDMCITFTSDEFETISMKTNEKGVFPTAAAMLRDCCHIIRN